MYSNWMVDHPRVSYDSIKFWIIILDAWADNKANTCSKLYEAIVQNLPNIICIVRIFFKMKSEDKFWGKQIAKWGFTTVQVVTRLEASENGIGKVMLSLYESARLWTSTCIEKNKMGVQLFFFLLPSNTEQKVIFFFTCSSF